MKRGVSNAENALSTLLPSSLKQARTQAFHIKLSLALASWPSAPMGHITRFRSASVAFYGTVKIDGANVPPGTLVAAWINGVKYAETSAMTFGSDTVYSMDVPGDDSTTPGIIEGGVPGSTVIFIIGSGAALQTGVWQSGTNVQLNLSRSAMPVPASVAIEIVPSTLIVNGSVTVVVTATVRDGSNQPVAGVTVGASTIPLNLGAVSLPAPTNASGQAIGTWRAGSVAGLGSLRVNSAAISSTAPITVNNLVPALINLSPMTVTLNNPSFTLTITGTHFVTSTLIQWNGTPRSTIFITNTQLQTLIANTDLVTTGTITITAFNPAPGGGESNALSVAIVPPRYMIYLPLIKRNDGMNGAAPLLHALSWLYQAMSRP